MRLFSRFITMLVASSTDPSYYIQILFRRFRSSAAFFLTVTIILSMITVFHWRFIQFPRLYTLIQKEKEAVLAQLPDSLFVRYQNHTLTVEGVPLPLRIPSSKDIQKQGVPALLLTFDDPDQKEALLRLRREDFSLTLPAQTGLTSRNVPYKDAQIADFTFTKTQLAGHLDTDLSSLPLMINVISLLFLPLYALFLASSLFMTILFVAVCAHSLVWLFGIRMRFIKMLQLCLHAGAVAAIVEEMRKILYPSSFISLLLPALISIMVLVLRQLGKKRYNT